MIKYLGMEYRVERKEYPVRYTTESLGRWLEAQTVGSRGKCVRERISIEQ